MLGNDPHFQVKIATDPQDLEAAQRLRYRVFVAELGGDGALVDHEAKLERDEFDPFFDHMILVDTRRAAPDHVVGVYRLLPDTQAAKMGRFYSEAEYDLSALKASGRKLLELGRSCLHEDYRGGTAMFHLWNGLAEYVTERGIEILFGVASFHGTDVEALAHPLSFLHHNHLAPEALRTRVVQGAFQPMDRIPADQVNRLEAMRAIPSLIKGYLRLGGYVGEGAFIDWEFNTIDVCLIMDTEKMSAKYREMYTQGRGA
jgi:putative hemolysin